MDTLWGLWALWQDGPVDPNTVLWGRPLWGWNRIGTVVQVFALIGLAFEIVGEKRVEASAEAIHRSRLFQYVEKSAWRPPDYGDDAHPIWHDIKTLLSNVFVVVFTGVVALFFLWLANISFRYTFLAPTPATTSHLVEFLRSMSKLPMAIVTLASASAAFGGIIAFFTEGTFALLAGISVILASPRLRTGLNCAIFAATAFNLHFTLLTQ